MKYTPILIVLLLVSLPVISASSHGSMQTVELTHEEFVPTATTSATEVTIFNMRSEPVFIHGWEDSTWMGEADTYTFTTPDYLSVDRTYQTAVLE